MITEPKLSVIAKLSGALRQLEDAMGLADLSQNEKTILYAFHTIADSSDSVISTEDVRSQEAVAAIPHATFHRSMAKLIEAGYIEHAPNTKAKLYKLSNRSA